MTKTVDEMVAVLEFDKIEAQLDAHPDWPYIMFISNGMGDNVVIVICSYTINEDCITAYNDNGNPLIVFPRSGTFWRIINRAIIKPSEVKIQFTSKNDDERPTPGQYV